jgi:polyisoprenoid-binding protein YceI
MTTTLTEQRAAARTGWSVDDAESLVEFAVKTLWGLTTVRGRFDRFDGTYEVGPCGTKIELTIDAASLDTGNRTRDKHLRSNDFFGVDEHPQVRFTSTRVVENATGSCMSRATSTRRARSCRSSSTRPWPRPATFSNSRQRRPSTTGCSE